MARLIPPAARILIEPYFPELDFDDIRIFTDGLPWYVRRFAVVKPSAVTIGSRIYFDGPDRFDPESIKGLALLAHEVAHVSQFKEYGWVRFLFRYLRDYLMNRHRGLSPADAYSNIPFEMEALSMQRRIERDLRAGEAGLS